jgi:hypothetical protein
MPWSSEFTINALKSGNLEVLKYCVKTFVGEEFSEDDAIAMMHSGTPEMLEFLFLHGCPKTPEICRNAGSFGKFEILRFAIQNGCPWNREESGAIRAAEDGDFKNLKWLLKNNCTCGPPTCCAAANSGNFEILRWLVDKKEIPWVDPNFTLKMFKKGNSAKNLEIFRWCLDHGCPPDPKILVWAAVEVGDLNFLNFLHAENISLKEEDRLLDMSAESGNFSVFLFLLKEGYEFSFALGATVIRGGNFQIFKILRSFPRHKISFPLGAALKYGNSEILKELAPPNLFRIFPEFFDTDDVEHLKFLRSHRVPFPQKICLSMARNQNWVCFKWLVENHYHYNEQEISKILEDTGYKRIQSWWKEQMNEK